MGDVTFGTLQPDGSMANVRVLKQSTIAKCPHFILSPEHYKADGTCLCYDSDEQARIKRERLERRAKMTAAVARQRR